MPVVRPVLALVALSLAGGPMPAAPSPVPDYSQTERAAVPDSAKWRISDLFPSEAAWQKGLADLKAEAKGLEALRRDWTASPKAMADLLEKVTALQLKRIRLSAYAGLQHDSDLQDPRFLAMQGEIQDFTVDFASRLTFLDPDILKLGKARLEACLKAEPRLAPYGVGFMRTLRMKGHVLPQNEERIAAMTGLFAEAPGKAAGVLDDVELPRPEVVLSDGSRAQLNVSTFHRLRESPNAADRRLVFDAYWGSQKAFQATFATLLDACAKEHLFDARIHGYPTTLDAALFVNDIDPSVYRNLVRTVRAHLSPLHRFLKLRQRMMGLPVMSYADVYASGIPSVERTYGYGEAQDLVRRATAPLGPEYAKALEGALGGSWVDVYPNKGKQSGAYSSDDTYGFHPFVKLNYDGSYNGVSTLAHELGHALHSHFTDQAQPYPLSGYPTFLAEIASTYNENLLMHHLLKTDTDVRFKLFVLDRYLEQLRGTLYRQALFADFELAFHERVEQGQSLTAEWLNAKYLELTRLYYGHDLGVVKVDEAIQVEWSGIPHFFYDYYVFQYSTGIVASMALSQSLMTEGAPARDRYLAMLRSGNSRFPLDTLRSAGVDLSGPAPVEAALKAFDDLVGEMETLAAGLR